MKLPRLSGQEVIKILQKIGFESIRQRGSHVRCKHSDGRVTSVPLHKEIGKGLLRRILKEVEISREEFFKLIKLKNLNINS
ncbi:MAG: type II toxin-antitoxin system HicA family toxin [Nanoarchaeota archaeon]